MLKWLSIQVDLLLLQLRCNTVHCLKTYCAVYLDGTPLWASYVDLADSEQA